MKRFFIGILCVLLSAVFAFGQTTTGRLSGTVTGPDGALPGATVTATDNKTGKEQTVTTNGEGNYLFPQLEFGTYTVTVTAQGFKKYVGQEVKIDVGRDYSLNPSLEVGDVSAEVVITAGADVISSNTAQVSNTVSPQQILSLPLITRNPLSLTTLQAGVSSNSAQNTSINGMRTTMTNITRDGINIQDTFIRSNATDFAPGRPSVDDTGEFTITTGNAEADQGYGGAQIRLVTPRGTKDFHGALFAYNRNSEFTANNFFNNRNADPAINSAPPFRNRNQFGGKASGPLPLPGFGEGTPHIYKDKGYFFFAYEGIRDPLSSRSTRTILTPAAQSGAFTWNRTNSTSVTPFCPSQTVGSVCSIPNLLDFARNNITGGNTLPMTIDPIIQSRVLSQLPTTSNFTGGDGLNTAGFTLNRQTNQERNTYTGRVDIDATDKDSVNFVYSFNKETNLRADADTTKFSVTPGVIQASANKTFVGAYRRVLGANFINEIRGGIVTSEVPFDRTDPIPDFFLAGLPVTFPENNFLTQGRNTKGFNLQDNADLIWGNHNLRFGGQMQVFKVNSYNDAGIVPTYTIGNTTGQPAFAATTFSTIGGINTTQLAMANSLLSTFGGVVRLGAQSFNIADVNSGFEPVRLLQPFRYENHSLYAFDRWMVTKNLTLTLGLRYELFPALRLINGVALEPVIADIDNPIPSLLDPLGTYNVIGGNAGRENAYYKTDWNNFAPNVGFSWSPNFESGVGKFLFGSAGKSVIRGGYSHIYGNDSIVTSINNAAVGNRGFGTTASNAVNPATNTTALNDRLSSGLTSISAPSFSGLPITYLQNNGPGIGNNFGTVFAVDPNIQIPRIDQYSFGFQREFFGNTAFEVRYVGTRSDNLARGIDINQIDIFNNGFLADFQRAQANLALPGATSAICNPATVAGCQPLTLFRTSTIGAGPLLVGSAALTLTTFNNNVSNGTVTDLALLFIQQGLNNHPTVADPNRVPFVNFLPNPGTGVVDLFLNQGFYNYNSLQVEMRRRFSNGLYFQANYTFSKNLTDTVGTSQNLFEPYLDNNNRDLDKQRADFDQTHVFNFNGIYQLPFGKGKMFLNSGGLVDKIFGGWEVSGLAQWTTGAPITFVDTRGTLNRGGRSARQTPNSSLTNDEIRALTGIFEQTVNGVTRIYFIDPSIISTSGAASNGFGSTPFAGQVFFNTNPGETGNIGRSLINGPKFFNINAALLKNIRFGETMRVQLRAEAFNLLNNVNFNISSTQQLQSITSTTFGQLTSTANSAREFQFAVRFEF